MHVLGRKHALWLAVLLSIWAMYGLVGRDAWKPDEAMVLGGLLDWRDRALLFQTAAAPLYTLMAEMTAAVRELGLDFQDGARLASGLFALFAFLFTGMAARALFGPGHEAASVLALMGCLGLMLRAHALLPDTAMLMAYALLLLGLAEARDHAGRGFVLLTAAFTSLALLRGGVDVAAGALIALLTMLSREWRTHALLAALPGALTICLLSVLALDYAAAVPGATWFDMSHGFLRNLRGAGAVLSDLAWLAWPAWPLAMWAIWHDHRRLGREFTLHPMLAALLVLFLMAHWPAYSREGGAIVLLAPLSLLAAKAMESLKRGASQALYWFGVLTFLFFAGVFWLYFAAIEWSWPAEAARHMLDLTPTYVSGAVGLGAVWLAAGATLLWLGVIPFFPRAKVRPVLVWATGMTLSWILLFSLFRPWADAGWGYRPMLEEMERRLPAQACLRAQVDPDMEVMLRYHLPDRYRRTGACDYWLIAGQPGDLQLAGEPMRLLWRGARPRYKRDVHSLYGVVRD